MKGIIDLLVFMFISFRQGQADSLSGHIPYHGLKILIRQIICQLNQKEQTKTCPEQVLCEIFLS